LIELLNKILEKDQLKSKNSKEKSINDKTSNQVIVFFSTRFHVEFFSTLYTK